MRHKEEALYCYVVPNTRFGNGLFCIIDQNLVLFLLF